MKLLKARIVYFSTFIGKDIVETIRDALKDEGFRIEIEEIDSLDLYPRIYGRTNLKIFDSDPQIRRGLRNLFISTGLFEENLERNECKFCAQNPSLSFFERRYVYGFRGCDLHGEDEAPGIDRIVLEFSE